MTDLEKELRANKLSIINLLAEQMVALEFDGYKGFTVTDDKPIAYLDATIDLLKKQIKNAKLGKAKLIKFDKIQADKSNLSEDELRQLAADQLRNDEIVDTFLATLEPRTSFKGNLHAPNSVILRYRGNIGSEFSKNFPFGVLL